MAGARPDTWMPLYIGDYLADTMHLTHCQHGIYMLLIMAYWRNGGPLPADGGLAAIAKCSPAEWRKHQPVIARFFHIKDGSWSHKRIDAELGEATDLVDERREAGRRGGLAARGKSGRPRKNSSAITDGGENPADENSKKIANGMANEWQKNTPSPSPSPEKKLASKDSDSLPREWSEAAAEERRKAGLAAADLPLEWVRFVRKIGEEPSLERWLGWVRKARADAPNGQAEPAERQHDRPTGPPPPLPLPH